jgi:hypothetical protein
VGVPFIGDAEPGALWPGALVRVRHRRRRVAAGRGTTVCAAWRCGGGFGGLPKPSEPFGVRTAYRRLERIWVYRRGFTVMRPATGQTVYRVLGRSQPRAWDFYSDRDKGRPRAPTQEFVDFVGISVFGTRTAALANCARFPKLVAELRLQPGNGFGVARTFADIDEHYSVWGDPESLLDHASGEVLRVDAPGLD